MDPRALPTLAGCCCAALVAGCFGFTAGVEEPDLAAQAAQVESHIVKGTTTRPEVNDLLGTPLFASAEWGVELYRSDRADASTEWMVILLVPVPGWTEVREYRLYPLVVYSPSGVVQGFGAGRYQERHQDNGGLKSPGGTNADVLGFTLAVDPCDEPGCLWLVAPVERSVAYLRAPPSPGRCVINLAMPGNGIEVVLDDQTLLWNSRSGAGASDPHRAEPWFARVTVSPGLHSIRAIPTGPSLSVGGELRHTIDCQGDQLFVVRVAAQVRMPTSFFSRAQLAGEIGIVESADAVPDDARAILFHNDRSLTASP